MKVLAPGFIVLFTLAFLIPENAQGQNMFKAWPALDEFHHVMSQTFHPAEDGDFAPIRSRSAEMMQQAKALKKSTIPAQFSSPAIRTAVSSLKKDSKKLHKQIKKGADDATIKTSLFALHDTFHQIVGLCRDLGEDH